MAESTRFVRRFMEASLICTLLATPVQAITATFGDIEITPEPAPGGNSWHGYFEYVFHLVNTSAERPHTVTLSIPFEKSYVRGDWIRELRRTVQVRAEETVHVSLLQPNYPPLAGRDVAVAIDGRRQEREVPLSTHQSQRFYRFRSYGIPAASPEPLILLGRGVRPLPRVEPMPPEMGGPTGGPPPGMPAGVMAPRPPGVMRPGKPGIPSRGFPFVPAETWSSNWLAYTRYDGIIVTAAELNALPDGARTALWQYVETGGALLVLGPTELRGLSAMREMTEDKGWRIILAGFGICRVSPNANYEAWDAEHFNLLMSDWRRTGAWYGGERPPQDVNQEFHVNQEFPVIDDFGIPIRGLFVLMFLFTLGIGPINVFVLSRLKRRIWLLWTTPALSLCTCLAVFGYMLVSEGWSGRLRTETLTLLDESTHRATTIGWTGFYSPLTPGDGLHFRYETEVIPQQYYDDREVGTRSCAIDWSHDQHFASGWVEARVPAIFKVRKSELRRERIALHRERDGQWSMVNGLGAAVRHFCYADAKGQIHEAANVAPGARVMLRPTEKESVAPGPVVQSAFSFTWRSLGQGLANQPERFLRPGQYLAEVDDSPFLEDALRNAQTRKLHALIVGLGEHDAKK